jgi:astacin (peptidase family M12A)
MDLCSRFEAADREEIAPQNRVSPPCKRVLAFARMPLLYAAAALAPTQISAANVENGWGTGPWHYNTIPYRLCIEPNAADEKKPESIDLKTVCTGVAGSAGNPWLSDAAAAAVRTAASSYQTSNSTEKISFAEWKPGAFCDAPVIIYSGTNPQAGVCASTSVSANSTKPKIYINKNSSIGFGAGFERCIWHELTHVLGFGHEHQREDRDDYLIVSPPAKITASGRSLSQFQRDCAIASQRPECLKSDPMNSLLDHSTPVGRYDFASIVHYRILDAGCADPHPPAGAQCGSTNWPLVLRSVALLSGSGLVTAAEVGTKQVLSKGDIAEINSRFGNLPANPQSSSACTSNPAPGAAKGRK